MEINITYKSPEHEAAFLSELQRIPHIVNPESGRVNPYWGASLYLLSALTRWPELRVAVIGEECVADIQPAVHVNVLDQWTYHSRLYRAARFVTQTPRTALVQLVSFGCGVDAITSDEVRSILESHGKPYTQIKIDEIANLGAARIRLRSLLAALGAE